MCTLNVYELSYVFPGIRIFYVFPDIGMSRYKDKTASRPSYFHNGNLCIREDRLHIVNRARIWIY